MDKFELDFDSNELDIMERPRPIQMMEPSLRTTVFVAQIQAGLWRRNGHSLLDQIHAYHDPRFRWAYSLSKWSNYPNSICEKNKNTLNYPILFGYWETFSWILHEHRIFSEHSNFILHLAMNSLLL